MTKKICEYVLTNWRRNVSAKRRDIENREKVSDNKKTSKYEEK